ncbi:MAG: TadE/TadG family type IV pilus assembly protein [Alphaproteobacteria bacterium]
MTPTVMTMKKTAGDLTAACAAILRRLGREARGAIAVEFALTVPIMLTAIFGTMELGRMGFTQAALQHAAEEATRFAIVREGQITAADIEAYAASKLTGVFDRDAAVIAAAAPIDPVTGTSLLSVQVNYEYQFLLPFLPNGGIQLSGNSSGFIAFPPVLTN